MIAWCSTVTGMRNNLEMMCAETGARFVSLKGRIGEPLQLEVVYANRKTCKIVGTEGEGYVPKHGEIAVIVLS